MDLLLATRCARSAGASTSAGVRSPSSPSISSSRSRCLYSPLPSVVSMLRFCDDDLLRPSTIRVYMQATLSRPSVKYSIAIPRRSGAFAQPCVAMLLVDQSSRSKASLPPCRPASLRSATRHTVAPRVPTTRSWIAEGCPDADNRHRRRAAPYIRLAGVDQRNMGSGRLASRLHSCHQPPVRWGTTSNAACRRRDRPTVGGSTTHPHRTSTPDRRL